MRITFLVRSLERGGAERQLVALAGGLRGRGHHVGVAVFYGGGPFERDLVAADVGVVDLGKRGRWDMARFVTRLIRTLRSDPPDILHAYMPVADILSAV